MTIMLNFFLDCNILDIPAKKNITKRVFVKVLPLLNVVRYLTGEYCLKNLPLPDKHYFDTLRKINNPNNTAYIDVFFLIGSILTEKGKCPTFPLFYGTYSGIKNNFKTDITEDYDDLLESEDFKHALGLYFTIEDTEIERDKVVNDEIFKNTCEIDFDDMPDINIEDDSKLRNGSNSFLSECCLENSDCDCNSDSESDETESNHREDAETESNHREDAETESNHREDAN